MKQANTAENRPDSVQLKKYWLVDNPGVLTRIAEELDVTSVFVGDVLYGRRKSTGGVVEKKLAKLGAPGF